MESLTIHNAKPSIVPEWFVPEGESWSSMLSRIDNGSDWQPVTEDTYWHFLEVLPPVWMGRGMFAFREGHEPLRLFLCAYGRHYARLLSWEDTNSFLRSALPAEVSR